MTDLNSVIFTPLGNVIRLFCVLCFAAATVAFAVAIRQKQAPLYVVLSAVHFALNFLLLVTVLDGTYGEEFFPNPRRWFAFITEFYSLPWAVAAVLIIISAAISTALFVNGYRFKQKTVSKSAIKESIDFLPTGICFGNTEGRIVFTNVQMMRFSREATGKSFNNIENLWQSIKSAGEEYGGSYLVAGDKAILFSRTEIDYFGETYTQITASDVSERYSVTLAFREKQKLLLDIQRREKEYAENVEQLALSRERLYMNANFHDEIGHLLLRGRYYFEHPEENDRAALMELIRDTNLNLFNKAERGDGDGYLDAITLADTIGVTVKVTGEPPADKSFRELVARAVHECSVNLVKHAGGDTLFVSFLDDAATFTNNGNLPSGEIVESGGLLSLRKLTEDNNGEMILKSSPRFELTLIK
ncbi:MAG: hypothetical protein K6F88_06720 [Ruminococcus sp.]|nr:hypothetical protein [Ruminococcus sp.]